MYVNPIELKIYIFLEIREEMRLDHHFSEVDLRKWTLKSGSLSLNADAALIKVLNSTVFQSPYL